MRQAQPSRTAERVAVERAAHQQLDTPLVFVDPLALEIIDAREAERLRTHPKRHDASPIARPTRAIVVVRSRIAEDEIARAVADGVRQYVLLGAGLDTFPYRNPYPALRVFEVDHPATQHLKLERLATAGIEVPAGVTFVPHDFASESPFDALRAAGFEDTRPAVFAWLGVVMYLEHGAVMRTLRALASLPEGTTVVFDYALPPSSLGWLTRMVYRRVLARLSAQGEPWMSFFEPGPLGRDLADVGFTRVEDLGAGDINARFLAGRRDGLRVGPVGRIAIARR